ncbi:glycosyltransferase family 2 protein [Vibrio fluvialis]|nr:glycosyltransferase family 2 protein [Vibrio fluvialis]
MCDVPLVSVLMPAYNVDRYIHEAIDSILKQSYKNFELIIIDDGSIDSTFAIAEKFALIDPRIVLIRNDINSNIVYSLNRGLSISKGKFILRMDSDDKCEPKRLENLINFLESNLEYDLVGTSITAIDENGVNIGKSIYYSSYEKLLKNIKYCTPVSHIWLARKDIYTELGGYRDIPGAEDYDFLLRMVTRGKKFTNLESDFSYSVRLNRQGNTSSLLGVKQLKLKKYVYSLFKERQIKFTDNYSKDKMLNYVNSSKLINKLHDISNFYLNKAIVEKSKNNYLKVSWYLLIAMVSPIQIEYLYGRFVLRLRHVIWRIR